MKLTSKNYFTAKNKHISNSDISNWKKCKNYFYKKKVTREIVQPITDALVIGSAVDCWLTEGYDKFSSEYEAVHRRSKGDDYRYQLTGKMLEEIHGMCKAVEATEAYKQIIKEKHKSQQILQWDTKINTHFSGICNIPDWMHIDKDGVCVITDLKTTAAIKGRSIEAKKINWMWKCLDYSYFRQQAMAQKILKLLHPEIKFFQSRHLIVEKDPDGIHNVYAWIISQDRIDDAGIELDSILEDIHNEINFNKLAASWSEDDVVGEYEE